MSASEDSSTSSATPKSFLTSTSTISKTKATKSKKNNNVRTAFFDKWGFTHLTVIETKNDIIVEAIIMAANTVVLDLGGNTSKFGLATNKEAKVIPNYISKAKNERRKAFVGDELDECKDFSGIFYMLPFQKGYLVNWDVQRQLFDYMFNKDYMHAETSETNLVVTEPHFNFTSIKECIDEILFEEHKFQSICRTTAAQLSSWKRRTEESDISRHICCLVVDSGFSFTNIVPICNGKVVKKAVRRLDVGGKVLTNYLKDIISYRQLHVLDETYVMNQVKEDCCYVSMNFNEDLETTIKQRTENFIARDYILPDYMNVKRGFIRPIEEMWSKYQGTEQLLRINNERFTPPELLFHPSDIGIQQMGIPEAIVDSISSCPLAMHPHMYMNIVLTGGNILFKGLKDRVLKDVRSLAPIDFDVEVTSPENPVTYAWQGGVALSANDNFLNNFCVTKEEYEENGRIICNRKFESFSK